MLSSCKNSISSQSLTLVVRQNYTTQAEDEYVIKGNDVLMKCKIPSFVTDQMSVINWIDEEGTALYPNTEYSKEIIRNHLQNY